MAATETADFPPVPEKQGENREKVGPGRPPAEHQFKPGQSGNPGGRPKGRSLTSILRELADATMINGQPIPGGKTLLDVLGEEYFKRALRGNFKFANSIHERLDGKVTDKLDVTSAGEPVQVVFYMPENGRDEKPEDPAAARPADGLPRDES